MVRIEELTRQIRPGGICRGIRPGSGGPPGPSIPGLAVGPHPYPTGLCSFRSILCYPNIMFYLLIA